MTMFFEAYAAPPQDVDGGLSGTTGAPSAALLVSGAVALRARAAGATMALTQGAQLQARMLSTPRARFGAVSALFGTLGIPTALLQVDNHLDAEAPSPEMLLWSGALLRMGAPPAAMTLSGAPTSSAAMLFGSVPTVTFAAQSTYQLNGTASLAAPSAEGLLAGAGADVLRGHTLAPRAWLQQAVPVQNYIGALVSASIQAASLGTTAYAISDSFALADSASGLAALWLRDSFALADAASFIAKAVASVTDGAYLSDTMGAVLRAILADAAHIADTPNAWLAFAQRIADHLSAGDSLDVRFDLNVAVALSFAARDLVQAAQLGALSNAASLADSLLAQAEHLATLLDAFSAVAALNGGAIIYALVADSANLSDALTAYAAVRQALEDGAQFAITLYTGQDTWTAWVMTPGTRAMRRYLNYPFNSYAQLGDTLYGASDTGVYTLAGDTDDGAAIYAAMRTGLLDFGTRQLKRMERAYLGYASDGTLCLRVGITSPTGSKVDYTYKMTAVPADAPREQRIQIGKGLKSVYWQFELDNSADGSNFELSDVTVLPMLLTRRV